ncbi:MAG: phospho-sugar mutase [Clostridiales bacterium]|nr:phospho-sugar mutase [Clostridiales bacterium]
MDYRAEYQRWLTEFQGDAEAMADLAAIAGDEAEIQDRFYAPLHFGTAGMRGVMGFGPNRMNRYTVRRAAAALGRHVAAQPGYADRGVAIAYDSRRNSAAFALEAATTLAAGGVRAHLFPSLRPVPVLSFAVRHLGAAAGIVITASHNPPQYNGFKAYWEDGGQMPPERAGEIQRLMSALTDAEARPMDEDAARAAGLLVGVPAEVDDAYMAAVKSLAIDRALMREMGGRLSIVYTPLNGAGNLPVRRMLRDMGFTKVHVVPEQELPDPDFTTVGVPNPEEPAAFELALKLREQLGADLVFGTDPDCDRVGIAVLDGDGAPRILSGNQIGCLLLHYVLSRKAALGTLPGNAAAVKSIVSTEMARAIGADFGVPVFDVLTGFKYIAEKIQEFENTGSHTFVFGFEESCGYLSGTDVRDKDGVNASMLIAEAAAYYKKRGMTLHNAMEELSRRYGYHGEKVVSVTLPGRDGLEKSSRIMKSLRNTPPGAIAGRAVTAVRDYLTGLRTDAGGRSDMGLPRSDVMYFELAGNAWACVRPSGTEPKIKLYVNAVAPTEARLSPLLDEIAREGARLLKA